MTATDTPKEQSLTTHVWPKSRMLFAIVSNMAKNGHISSTDEQGVLKDLILEEDEGLMKCYSEYESLGDKERLYKGFKAIA